MRAYEGRYVEQAFTEHGPGLVRHLAFLTRDRELAEDVAQEAFLRLAREVEAGRSPESTGAWLHRVGRNLTNSWARHEQVAARREAELPRPSQPASPEAVAEERELGNKVNDVLAELSSSERRALVLAAHGVGGIEIAAIIGRTPGATRTLMCRARAKVRERIAGTGLVPA